jgi:TPR repeat protein
MKRFVLAAVLLYSFGAHADPLADANALFAKKSYPEALQLYTRLGNAGNVEAQQHLGEMYWYGEAGAVDEAKAESWFRKAAVKGNAVAIASLAMMKERSVRRKDIDYWVERYQGEDLKAGKFHCATPRIPAISKQSQDIERVNAAVEAWQNCYNAYVTNLNAASPLVQRIPPDIVKLMNQAEMTRTTERLAMVHENLSEEARVSSKLVLADLAAWRSATEAYVKEHNEIVAAGPSEERAREIEARKRNYATQK